MHKYLRIVSSFQRVTNLGKSVSMQHYFEQFVGNQRRLERTHFGISEAERLKFKSVGHILD